MLKIWEARYRESLGKIKDLEKEIQDLKKERNFPISVKSIEDKIEGNRSNSIIIPQRIKEFLSNYKSLLEKEVNNCSEIIELLSKSEEFVEEETSDRKKELIKNEKDYRVEIEQVILVSQKYK